MATENLNPFFAAFQIVHDCLRAEDPNAMADCVVTAVRATDPQLAGDICGMTDKSASLLLNTSPTLETCKVITDKSNKSGMKKLMRDCAQFDRPLDSVAAVLKQCKRSGTSDTTQWAVVLGIAIPIGLIGLIVMLSCMYAVVRMTYRNEKLK